LLTLFTWFIRLHTDLRAIKTYIRTKSGRLIERIVFMTEEDYQAFLAGGDAARDILGKYLSKDEAANLDSWDKEEQHAITVYVRTKSGRRIAKVSSSQLYVLRCSDSVQ